MVKDVFFSVDEESFLKGLRLEINKYFKGRTVAVKIHMGEEGNKYYLKPRFVKKIVDLLKDLKLKPFLFDSPVVYASKRRTVEGYEELARKHGFYDLGCDVVISNDSFTEEVEVNGRKMKFGVCRSLMDADNVLVLSHVKGHQCSGFGASIKNLGMGALTRESKGLIHKGAEPVYLGKCTMCGECAKACPTDNIRFEDDKPSFDNTWCCGCSSCCYACKFNAIRPKTDFFDILLAAGAEAALRNFNNVIFVNVLKDISKLCDCMEDGGPIVVADIGYLISRNVVAIDKAAHDLILQTKKRDVFKELHHKSPLVHIKDMAKFKKVGLDYTLIKIK